MGSWSPSPISLFITLVYPPPAPKEWHHLGTISQWMCLYLDDATKKIAKNKNLGLNCQSLHCNHDCKTNSAWHCHDLTVQLLLLGKQLHRQEQERCSWRNHGVQRYHSHSGLWIMVNACQVQTDSQPGSGANWKYSTQGLGKSLRLQPWYCSDDTSDLRLPVSDASEWFYCLWIHISCLHSNVRHDLQQVYGLNNTWVHQ